MIPASGNEWQVAHGRFLKLEAGARIMAIVNATPDSFSDGGRYMNVETAVAHALSCVEDGADIIDIGGESTRPGARAIEEREEQDRVLPVIERLARETPALISIDTYRAETARLALKAGAHIVNDVYGLQKDAAMAATVAAAQAGVCIMHTGRERDRCPDVIDDQFEFLNRSLDIAASAAIAHPAIVLDPGFGFAKDADENLALMARFEELHGFGLPLLAGVSRKRFLGAVTGRDDAAGRDAATAAACAMLRMAGAAVFRVHNVAMSRDALAVADAVLRYRNTKRETMP